MSQDQKCSDVNYCYRLPFQGWVFKLFYFGGFKTKHLQLSKEVSHKHFPSDTYEVAFNVSSVSGSCFVTMLELPVLEFKTLTFLSPLLIIHIERDYDLNVCQGALLKSMQKNK